MANQYSDSDTCEYNGWANRSTWNIHLWLSNEYHWQRAYENWVMQAAHDGDSDKAFHGAKLLYRAVYEQSAKADGCVWSHIDWSELRRHFDDAVKYAREG